MDPRLVAILLTMVPGLEYRAAIPYAVLSGASPYTVIPLLIAVNLATPILTLVVARRLTGFFLRIPLISRLLTWSWDRTSKKREKVEKYGYPALSLLVFVPLPGTGMWTAVLLAYLMDLDPLRTLLWGALGLIPSALIIYLISSGLS